MANFKPKGVERMREIGKLGGTASARLREKRFRATERRLLATIAARARWGKLKWSPAEEAAWREGYYAAFAQWTGWPRDRKAKRIFLQSAG